MNPEQVINYYVNMARLSKAVSTVVAAHVEAEAGIPDYLPADFS